MKPSLPNAKNARSPEERAKIKHVIIDRGLCGLANDTKWNEFLDAMRAREDWRPSYRCKCVDGPASDWDAEWFYHLPFPLIYIEWLDMSFLQEERRNQLITPVVTDHSVSLETLLKKVGLDYRKGTRMIRVFGYSPRSTDLFDQ